MIWSSTWRLLAILTAITSSSPTMALKFSWPNQTAVCGTYPLTITEGTPPFQFIIMPLKGLNSIRDIGAPVGGNWTGAFVNTQVQVPYGAWYTILLSDGSGFGGGGILPPQSPTPGETSCLQKAGYNETQRLFNFNVSGSTAECDSNFRVTLDGPSSQGPYNFSVIPLDGGYQPWFVDVGTKQYYDWKVNMTAGSVFTIMFNNKFGNGTGGIGGFYQVTNGSSPGCATQTRNTTAVSAYTLPKGLTPELLPAAQDPPVTSDSGGSSTSISSGAIAGIAIGAAAGVAIVVLVIYLFRRKRKVERERGRRLAFGETLDLAEDANGDAAPSVEPWVSPPASATDTNNMAMRQALPPRTFSETSTSKSPLSETPYLDLLPASSPGAAQPYSTNNYFPSGAGSSSGQSSTSSPSAGYGYGYGHGHGHTGSTTGPAAAANSDKAVLLQKYRPNPPGSQRGPEAVRHHVDGGLVEMAPEDLLRGEEEETELPPMYVDVPKSGMRRGDGPGSGSGSGSGSRPGEGAGE